MVAGLAKIASGKSSWWHRRRLEAVKKNNLIRRLTDEMLLLIQGLFHSFLVMSAPC
jgi:hypothetical protein